MSDTVLAGLPENERTFYVWGIKQIREGMEYIDKGKAIVKDAKDRLGTDMMASNMSAVSAPTWKLEYVKEGASAKLDKEKVKEHLLLKGVDAQTIRDAFEYGTTVGTRKAYVKYSPKKEQKDD